MYVLPSINISGNHIIYVIIHFLFMLKDKIFLIGPMDIGNVPTNGVTMKNQLFYKRFLEIFPKVRYIDTWKIKYRPWVVIKIIFAFLFYRNYKFIISGSHASRRIFNFVYWLRLKRYIVFWVAGGNLPSKIEEGIYNVNALNYIHALIVQGVSMRNKLQDLGINNVIYVPNSKPISFYPDVSHFKKSDKIRFVFLSRVHPEKGCDDIFKCARMLNINGFKDRYEIDFYGSVYESYRVSFEKQITEFSNVNYRGFLNVVDKNGYKKLSTYDVMLFPTFWMGEGFPGVVIDAYIAGLPIIASDWNLNKEVIKDGETGFIIRTKDVQQLYARMVMFIENKINLTEMRITCAKVAQNFEYRKVLSEELMRKVGFN